MVTATPASTSKPTPVLRQPDQVIPSSQPQIVEVIPDSMQGYWVPAGYAPMRAALVWCVSRDRFGVFHKPSGWRFCNARAWREGYRDPNPCEMGLSVTEMALLTCLTPRIVGAEARPWRTYLGVGTLRDALIRAPEAFAAAC